jgi:hypothetical protein
MQVGVGVTDLGRGIIAKEDLAADTTILTVDAWSTLLVCDEPLRTGDAFGASVLSEWQSLWGIELPPQLNSYLKSSRCACRPKAAATAAIMTLSSAYMLCCAVAVTFTTALGLDTEHEQHNLHAFNLVAHENLQNTRIDEHVALMPLFLLAWLTADGWCVNTSFFLSSCHRCSTKTKFSCLLGPCHPQAEVTGSDVWWPGCCG